MTYELDRNAIVRQLESWKEAVMNQEVKLLGIRATQRDYERRVAEWQARLDEYDREHQ